MLGILLIQLSVELGYGRSGRRYTRHTREAEEIDGGKDGEE
jgi:hypothetical protein